MSLRWRWALTLSTVAAVTIGVVIAASLYATRTELRNQVDDDLRARVDSADVLSAFDGMPGRGFGGPRGLGQLVELDAVVRIIDAGGGLILAFEGDPAPPVTEASLSLASSPGPPILEDVDLDGVHHRMIVAHVSLPGPQRQRISGAIQIAVDVSDIDESLTALVTQLGLIGLGAVILAGLVGWMLAWRTVRPIEVLTSTAERVADTEVFDADLDAEAPGEIGRLAGSFAKMLRSLSESRAQQQRLISDAGHEFRTPLTALRTNLETLIRRDDALAPTQRAELLAAALEETVELSDLATELVDLATDVQHSDEPERRVDLVELAHAVAGRFRRRTGRSIVVVSLDGDVVVQGRAGQLDRAIGNLVDNAVKWSPPDQPIEITVRAGRLDVRDHGEGISDEDLPHVFERFYRSAGSRSGPGSGLGLAIVKHVVAAHGGEVFAGNAPGGGAIVGFSLPS